MFSDAMDWELPALVQKALVGCRFVPEEIKKALSSTLEDPQILNDICTMMEEQF